VSRIVALALGAALSTVTLSALADEPIPPDTTDPNAFPRDSTRWTLVLGGVGMTGVWYGAAVGFSYLWPDAPGAMDLRIPVAGPWMALADTGCADDEPDCSMFKVVLRAVLTTFDAIGQTGGIGVALEGLFLPTATGPAASTATSGVQWTPVPVVTEDGHLGLGVFGRF